MKKGDRTEMDMGKLSNAVEGKTHHYPSILRLDEGDLPEVKNWKTGQTYKVELEIKQIRSSIKGMDVPYDDYDKDKVHCEFEVISAETYDDKEEKE